MTVLKTCSCGLHASGRRRAGPGSMSSWFGLQDKRDVEVEAVARHEAEDQRGVLARHTPLVLLDEPTFDWMWRLPWSSEYAREYATNEGARWCEQPTWTIQDLCGRVIILSRARGDGRYQDHWAPVPHAHVRHQVAPRRGCGCRGLAAGFRRGSPRRMCQARGFATLSGGDDIHELMDLLRARRLASRSHLRGAGSEQVFLRSCRANGEAGGRSGIEMRLGVVSGPSSVGTWPWRSVICSTRCRR